MINFCLTLGLIQYGVVHRVDVQTLALNPVFKDKKEKSGLLTHCLQ